MQAPVVEQHEAAATRRFGEAHGCGGGNGKLLRQSRADGHGWGEGGLDGNVGRGKRGIYGQKLGRTGGEKGEAARDGGAVVLGRGGGVRRGGDGGDARLFDHRRTVPGDLHPFGLDKDLAADGVEHVSHRHRPQSCGLQEGGGEGAVLSRAVQRHFAWRGGEDDVGVHRGGEGGKARLDLANVRAERILHFQPGERVVAAAVEDDDLPARPCAHDRNQAAKRDGLEGQVVDLVKLGVGGDQVVLGPDLHAVARVVEQHFGVTVDVEEDALHQPFEIALGGILQQGDVIALTGEEVCHVQRIVPGIRQLGRVGIGLVADDDGVFLARSSVGGKLARAGGDMAFGEGAEGAVLRRRGRGGCGQEQGRHAAVRQDAQDGHGLAPSTAAAAIVAKVDVDRLGFLLDHGCDLGGHGFLDRRNDRSLRLRRGNNRVAGADKTERDEKDE